MKLKIKRSILTEMGIIKESSGILPDLTRSNEVVTKNEVQSFLNLFNRGDRIWKIVDGGHGAAKFVVHKEIFDKYCRIGWSLSPKQVLREDGFWKINFKEIKKIDLARKEMILKYYPTEPKVVYSIY